jgi:hypothetical protein
MVEDTLKDRFYHITALPKQGLTTELQKALWESLRDKTVDALSETYITRYPELVNIHDFYSNPINGESRIPGSADIAHNVICSKVKFTYRYIEPEKKYYQYDTPIECDKYKQSYIRDTSRDMLFTIGGERGELYLNSNYPAVPEDFEDASWGDLTIKANSKAYAYGYKNTDFYSIGLEHIKRINNPAVIQTRIEPSQDYDQTLLIGMRNKGAESVRGVLKVYAKGKVTFSINEISFSINSGKEMYYPLEILNYDGAFEIEVRSEIPGVRPSRYAYEG